MGARKCAPSVVEVAEHYPQVVAGPPVVEPVLDPDMQLVLEPAQHPGPDKRVPDAARSAVGDQAADVVADSDQQQLDPESYPVDGVLASDNWEPSGEMSAPLDGRAGACICTSATGAPHRVSGI